MKPRKKYIKHKENPTSYKKLTWEEYTEKYLDDDGNKMCRTCGLKYKFEDFPNNSTSPFGKLHHCRLCHNLRCRTKHRDMQANSPAYRERLRNRHKLTAHGISSEEYDRRLNTQKICAICSVLLKGGHQTHLDHNHTTGKLRDFLCTNCNRGLGHFQDSTELLIKASNYLIRHNEYDEIESEGSRP